MNSLESLFDWLGTRKTLISVLLVGNKENRVNWKAAIRHPIKFGILINGEK